jgi:hypothetical protein
MDRTTPKYVTIVLEMNDGRTMEQLLQLFNNSIYVEGCRIVDIYDCNIPELLDECNHQYSELLIEHQDSQNEIY